MAKDFEKHYDSMCITPFEFIGENGTLEEIDAAFMLQVLKYISRKKEDKDLDLMKAKSCIEHWQEYRDRHTKE